MQTGPLNLCILGDVSMLSSALSPQLIACSSISGAPFLLIPNNVFVISTLLGAFTCTIIAALHAVMYIRCFAAMSLNGQGAACTQVRISGLLTQFGLTAIFRMQSPLLHYRSLSSGTRGSFFHCPGSIPSGGLIYNFESSVSNHAQLGHSSLYNLIRCHYLQRGTRQQCDSVRVGRTTLFICHICAASCMHHKWVKFSR
jgi:hypothetical protein